ncbi:MAG: helix-turn-helix domain-containing protein [Pseudomonadota bacterium]
MYLKLLKNAAFYVFLAKIDRDLAAQVQANGCPFCEGHLHDAHYQRAGRGGFRNIPSWVYTRWSLCCGRAGCRRRTLPPSCLFLGRRWYWQGVILVAITMHQQRRKGYCVEQLITHFGVSRATVWRWLKYFREVFPQTSLWRSIRGLVGASVRDDALPQSLLEHFESTMKDAEEALGSCLRFLATGVALGGQAP